MNKNKKIVLTIILLIVSFSQAWDIVADLTYAFHISHIIIESILVLFGGLGIVIVWSNTKFLMHELEEIRSELQVARVDSNKWKMENETLIKGLSESIDKKFDEWKLTPSEKEISLLLLKGLSLKYIAEIRDVSERTVRQQSVNIYHKSGLAGRAELSAYFLEDLLTKST